MSRLPAEWIPTGTPHRSMSDGYHAKPPCHNDVCMVMTPAATCWSVGRGLRKPDTKPTVDAEAWRGPALGQIVLRTCVHS